MLEKEIERRANDIAKKSGILNYKFTSPGHNAVPDRMYLRQIPPEHREIVAKYVQFIEYKRAGQEPTPPQEREHLRLRGLGFKVSVVDYYPQITEVLKDMMT